MQHVIVDTNVPTVALTHPQKPPILNATDTDWWHYHLVLAPHRVQIEFLCPDAMQRHEPVPITQT